MKLKHLFFIGFFVFMLSFTVSAHGGNGYWGYDLPVMDGAVNVIEKKDERISTLSKTYDIQIKDPVNVLDFYSAYFESFGWKNPTKLFSMPEMTKLKFSPGWSGYHMDINPAGKPEAVYVVGWNSKDPPAIGSLRVKLIDYSDGMFFSTIKVAIAPKIDVSALFMQIHELLYDPRNFFKLFSLLEGNPFEIDKIQLEKITQKTKHDPVVAKYLSIVNEILAKYKLFHEDHNH